MKKLLFTSILILLVNCNQTKEIAEIDNPVKKEIIDSFGLNKEEKEIIAQRQMPVKNLDDEI